MRPKRSDGNHEPTSDILRRRLAHFGLDQAAQAAWICTVANRFSHGRFEAVRFRNNTLVLKAPNAIVASELRLTKHPLLIEIRTALKWPEDRPLTLTIRL